LADKAAKPTVFVREATGLVREVGAWSSFLAVFALVTGGVPILFIATMYTAPGANWPLAFFVAFLPTLLMAGLFTVIGASMPRAGGDYVFVTRSLNPFVGFVNNWGLAIAFILNFGIFSYLGSQYIGYLFTGLGAYNHDSGLAALGSYVVQLGPTFVIAVALIVISTLIAMLRPKYAWGFVLWTGIATLVVTVVLMVGLAGISQGSFKVAYNSFMANQTAYDSVITTGGIVAPASGLLAIGAALPFTWFAYTWYNLPTTWAGEMKNVKKSMPIAIMVGIAAIAVYYISFSYFTINAFGQAFLTNWSSLVSAGTPPIAGIGNFIPFFALLVYHSPILYVAMFLALWLQDFISFPALVISQTRYIFAWSFDRVLPEKFASVNDRLHTPLVATILVAIGGTIGAALDAFLPSSPNNYSGQYVTLAFTIFSFGFIIPAIAGAIFPFRRKQIYEANFVAKKKFGLPLISWLGIGSMFYLIYSTYLASASGTLPLDPTTWQGQFTLLLYGTLYGLGIVVFIIGYLRNKRRGLSLDLVFKEIPPE
jgi:amino acid transporter